MYLSKTVAISFAAIASLYLNIHSMEERENKVQSQLFTYGVFSTIGGPFARYKRMEDTYVTQVPLNEDNQQTAFFAVFDGHGGDIVSEFAKNHIVSCINSIESDNYEDKLKLGLKKLNEKIKTELQINPDITIGSCAILALINGDDLYIANLGDSRAILSRQEKTIALSTDQNVNRKDEAKRIRQLVVDGKPVRMVNGEIYGPDRKTLAVSRALGDFGFIPYGIIDDAEIQKTTFNNEDDFLILASDGVFEVGEGIKRFANKDAVRLVSKALRSYDNNAEYAARALGSKAIANRSADNITVIVIVPNKINLNLKI